LFTGQLISHNTKLSCVGRSCLELFLLSIKDFLEITASGDLEIAAVVGIEICFSLWDVLSRPNAEADLDLEFAVMRN